jgi:hypothetical protein
VTERHIVRSPVNARQSSDDQLALVPKPLALRYLAPTATTLPGPIAALGVAGCVGLVAAFWLFFHGSQETIGALSIVTFLAAVFVGVPFLMIRTRSRHRANTDRSRTLPEFLAGNFDTSSGPVSGWSALLQYSFLPIALAIGAVVIGIIFKVIS